MKKGLRYAGPFPFLSAHRIPGKHLISSADFAALDDERRGAPSL
jgi:hypothetical protein